MFCMCFFDRVTYSSELLFLCLIYRIFKILTLNR